MGADFKHDMTILYSNCSPKIPKEGIIGPKFKNFYFCNKLCVTSNMTTVFFFKFQPKNTQIWQF